MHLKEAIDATLGCPWRLHGRGPEVFDCLGLALWLYRHGLGLALQDPAEGLSVASVRAFQGGFLRLQGLAAVGPGDLLRERGKAQHFAVVEGPYAAEVREGGTVCRTPLEAFLRPGVEAWRPRALCSS